MSDKERIVLKAMQDAGKAVRLEDVVEATGLDKKEVSKIISDLKKQGKIISPKRCFYSPANE